MDIYAFLFPVACGHHIKRVLGAPKKAHGKPPAVVGLRVFIELSNLSFGIAHFIYRISYELSEL